MSSSLSKDIVKSRFKKTIGDEATVQQTFGKTYDELYDYLASTDYNQVYDDVMDGLEQMYNSSGKEMDYDAAESIAMELEEISKAIHETQEDESFSKGVLESAREGDKNRRQEEFRKLENAKYKLNPYKNRTTKLEIEDISPSILSEYGNNYFELTTLDDAGKSKTSTIRLAGVLKEIPSFSMSTTWAKGPASTMADTVKGYMCSPMMEMLTTLGGRDRSWMNLDEGTDRTYASTDKPSFELSFKLYTNENIGSMALTDYKTWIKALALYTMPSIASKVSINAMANNALNGLYGAGSLLKGVFEDVKKSVSDQGSNSSFIEKAENLVSSLINSTTEHIQSRYGDDRVKMTSNIKNYYGAKIWYLRILPGIFRKPLIVYIDNWGVTYSKETNPETFEPIWVEFKISCKMDQVASAPVWMRYLTGSINVKNSYKPYTEPKQDDKKN